MNRDGWGLARGEHEPDELELRNTSEKVERRGITVLKQQQRVFVKGYLSVCRSIGGNGFLGNSTHSQPASQPALPKSAWSLSLAQEGNCESGQFPSGDPGGRGRVMIAGQARILVRFMDRLGGMFPGYGSVLNRETVSTN